MSHPKRLRLYLEDELRQSVAAGRHNFLCQIVQVAEAAGFRVDLCPNTDVERLKGATRRGYALTHMTPPVHARCLVTRRVYHYPFWQIDASDQRWDWAVARCDFQPDMVDRAEADRFFAYWQKRLFAPMLDKRSDDGFLYMPLQGRLLEHRGFQRASPMDMIRYVRSAVPDRKLVATLHPKEVYTTQELALLDRMAAEDANLQIDTGARDTYLPRCHAIVTQNSSVAFDGYFLEKPVVLFAGADFHHIALKGPDQSLFDALGSYCPDYAGYVWWFWQKMSINAGHMSSKQKILDRLSAAGWPMQ